MKHEHGFQASAFVYLKRARPFAYITSVECNYEPDGTEHSRLIMIKRRERGILPGQADIRMLDDGLSIDFECKDRQHGIQDNQLLRREELLRNGGHWFSVRTLEQIEAALISVGRPPRARLGGLPVAVPTVSARRLAGFERRKLDDAVPF